MNMIIRDVLEGVEVPTKPATNFIAVAVQHPNGKFLAQWAAPGMIPAFVVDGENQTPVFYDSAEDAEDEARFVLFEALNSRKRDTSKREVYRRLTGPEFCVALAEANLTPTFWSYIYGTTQDRTLKMMDGAENVPHQAMLLLEIFKQHPETIDTAEAATERVTTERKPRRD